MFRIKAVILALFCLIISTLSHASDEPIIITQPKNIAECVGGVEALKIKVIDGVLVTYQWQKSTDKLNWENIDKANAAVYAPAAQKAGTTWYRAIVTVEDKNGKSVVSEMAEVKIAEMPNVSINVANSTNICTDTKVKFIANSSGGIGDCKLTWQYMDESKEWKTIENESGNTLSIDNISPAKRYRAVYKCSGSGCCN